MAMNVEAEIRDLKRRIGELEGSFGFLTQQVKAIHKDLLEFEEKTEQRFDKVDKRFDRLEGKVDGLAKALPSIVGDAVREANRERGQKR
jgi:predicted  nucleic acid-binding Zn-ribbon protein